jgi:hypothetical protein
MTQTHNKDCACCGFPTLSANSIFEICPLCGWQDDALQNGDPDYSGGANELSLNGYRQTLRPVAIQLQERGSVAQALAEVQEKTQGHDISEEEVLDIIMSGRRS